jgi:hypothetical protein
MVEKNYQFLSETLSQLGFGDALNDALKTKMKLGMPEFELKAKDTYNKDQMLYTLKFGKKEDGDFYFLNAYNAKLTKEKGETITQNFPLYKQRGYSAEEAYNMLSGRAVYKTFSKDGERIGRWSRLDFTTQNEKGNFSIKSYYDNNSNFNLVKELGKLPLLLATPQEDKESLIRGLQKGNLEPVIVKQQGQRERMYIEATPQLQKVTMYNSDMEKVNLSNNKMQIVQEEKIDGKLPETTKKIMEKVNTPAESVEPQKKVHR